MLTYYHFYEFRFRRISNKIERFTSSQLEKLFSCFRVSSYQIIHSVYEDTSALMHTSHKLRLIKCSRFLQQSQILFSTLKFNVIYVVQSFWHLLHFNEQTGGINAFFPKERIIASIFTWNRATQNKCYTFFVTDTCDSCIDLIFWLYTTEEWRQENSECWKFHCL